MTFWSSSEVLEYVWEDFFNSIGTVDPATGHSQLIEEVMQGIEEEGQSSDSRSSWPTRSHKLGS